jgi:Zn-dependent peptidase ImmA (M78 family)
MTERGAEILGKVDPAHKIVYLDNKTRDDRQRYTLAHEIGHIVLHADRGCDMMFRPQDPRAILRPTRPTIPDSTVARTEREANTFAAELLMPEKTVLHEFERRFKTPRMWVQSKDAFQIAGLMSPSAKDTAQKLALHSSASAIPLKDFFGVSSPAMERRILELGLVY